MYTIVMDKYKNLNTTVKTSLFQNESMVDKIQFLIPPEYNGAELKDYIVTLKYVDPNGNFHAEALTLDEELYKDYLRYELPVTTKLTQVVGTLTLRLTLIKFEPGTSGGVTSEHTVVDETMVVTENEPQPSPIVDPTTTVIDKLESNSTTLMIRKPDGFNDYVNFEDIEAFKAQIAQLNRDVAKMPNDLAIDEKDYLHLTRDGEAIGVGVEVLVPGDNDLDDGNHNGIIETDELDTTDDNNDPNFIEL